MPAEPAHYVVCWNGKLYKSLQHLVTGFSLDSDYILGTPDYLGPVAVYFTDRPVMDLTELVEQVFEDHRATHPARHRDYRSYYAPKPEVKAWRTALRQDLRARIEAISPIPYKD